MLDSSETLVVEGSKELATAIQERIEATPGSRVQVTERSNLDGTPADAIVFARLAMQSLPSILAFLTGFASRGSVKRVKWNNLEIDRPRPEDVDRILKLVEQEAQRRMRGG